MSQQSELGASSTIPSRSLYIRLEAGCARRACASVSTSLRWRFRRWDRIDARKVLTSKPRRNGRIIGLLPDIGNFATGALPCQPASARPRFNKECGDRRCASVTVCGRPYAVKESGKSLVGASWVVVFYHFLQSTDPSNPRGSCVCKEPLLSLPAKYLLDGYLLVHPALKSLTGGCRRAAPELLLPGPVDRPGLCALTLWEAQAKSW